MTEQPPLPTCGSFEAYCARMGLSDGAPGFGLVYLAWQAATERAAVTAWNHHMDHCKKIGVSPATYSGWCSATAIRGD